MNSNVFIKQLSKILKTSVPPFFGIQTTGTQIHAQMLYWNKSLFI